MSSARQAQSLNSIFLINISTVYFQFDNKVIASNFFFLFFLLLNVTADVSLGGKVPPLLQRKNKERKHSQIHYSQTRLDQSETLKRLFVIFLFSSLMRVVYFAASFNFHTLGKTQERHGHPHCQPAICKRPFRLLNTYQMGVKLLPSRVW